MLAAPLILHLSLPLCRNFQEDELPSSSVPRGSVELSTRHISLCQIHQPDHVFHSPPSSPSVSLHHPVIIKFFSPSFLHKCSKIFSRLNLGCFVSPTISKAFRLTWFFINVVLVLINNNVADLYFIHPISKAWPIDFAGYLYITLYDGVCGAST